MNLKQRLKTMEAEQKSARPTKTQAEQQLDELLAKNGLKRATAVSKYGSVGAFCYALLLKECDNAKPELNAELTAQERYLQLLKKG